MRRHPVTVVVVAYRSGSHLHRAAHSALAAGAAHVILVDNSPDDPVAARVAAALPHTSCARMARNIGFAAGCNEGVRRAQTPFVLLLNDDAVLTEGYLDALLPALHGNHRAAAAIGKLLRQGEPVPRIDSAGIRLDKWSLCARDVAEGAIDVGQCDAPGAVFGATGAAALYRTDVFVQAGGFDEALFAYYEDVDLAWRLGAQGYLHLYVPAAVAYHGRRGLRGKARDTVLRAHLNRYTVWAKNEGLKSFCLRLPVALPREALRMLRFAGTQPGMCLQVIRRAPRAIVHGLARRPARGARR